MKASLFALSLVAMAGCGSQDSTPSAPGKAEGPPPVIVSKPAVKAIEVIPPTNIGDGSPIVFTHLKGGRKGKGKFTDRYGSQRVDTISFELNPDGSLLLSPDREGPTVPALRGTWAKRDDKTVDIVVDDAKGTILFMDRANPTSFKLRGKDAAGRSLSLDFKVSE